MTKIANWLLATQNAPRIYWAATAAAIAHPRTRKRGLQALSFGSRATWNMTVASSRALLSTPLVRGGAFTLGSAGGSVLAGYAIGATAGTAISYGIWGEEGADTALDLYTGGVSFGDYVHTVRTKFASYQ